MKGIREVFTTEQLYEELRPRLSKSDAWLAQQHPGLLKVADGMVEALQKKESYGGGVAQRAAHLAAHLKATDPILARWMERQQVLEAAKAAREAAAAAAAAPAEKTPARPDAAAGNGTGGAAASSAAAALGAADAMITGTSSSTVLAPGGGVAAPGSAPEVRNFGGGSGAAQAEAAGGEGAGTERPTAGGGCSGGGAGAGAAREQSPGSSDKGGRDGKGGGRSGAKGGGKDDVEDKDGTAPRKSGSSKGGAATALEYLTTTFAHLREQRTLVMGDKKDRLLKEVAGLRQLRAGHVNVLRGGLTSETSMADMLAALKAADADPAATVKAAPPAEAQAAGAAAGAMEVDGEKPGLAAVPEGPCGGSGGAAGVASGKSSGGGGGGGSSSSGGTPPGKGYLDNLTCVLWEDWRIPERLDKLLRAGDTVVVYVEVHCRDGPEDVRLAMRLSTFVALALCSQRLIAELYHDMFITPQRAAAARPQRKRQRTAAEETVQTLEESPDSLDFVDFVEALHRRMPLRCGWMYANAILPTAREWDRVFGRQAGRLSGLYEGGPELDSLGRSCLGFHQTRHESPVLDVHELAARLRRQQQQWQQQKPEAAAAAAAATAPPAGWPRNAVEVATTTSACCCEAAAAVAAATESPQPPAPSSLIVRSPQDSSGRQQGLDLGHLSFTCVTAAPLSDDFLGEVVRLTTAGQAAAEVAAAAAAAAKLRASRCIASGGANCTGTCVADAAEAEAAAAAAAAAAADYLSWGGVEGFPDGVDGGEDDEERELFDAVTEELQAVEAAAVEAEREVELEMEMEGKVVKKEEGAASVYGGGGSAGVGPMLGAVKAEAGVGAALGCCLDGSHPPHHHHLKGAFSHRMQLFPGVFFSYYIGSQAFTNTAWHVEDFLLQSINLMMVGRPKAWWWVPRDKEAVFKEYLEEQWDAEDVYTKSVPLAGIPLDKLIKMGVRRSVQLPGAIFITSPGYAFHTTMSSGWSMADSANFMANIVGKDMHVLDDERPLEQYPPTEGRTNTGEWVRFTMRRIEELRARNDPSYAPRPLRRIRAQVEARRAAAEKAAAEKAKAAAAAAAAGGAAGVDVKSDRDGADPADPAAAAATAPVGDKMLRAHSQGTHGSHGSQHKAAGLKMKAKSLDLPAAALVGLQQQQQQLTTQPQTGLAQQQQLQHKARQRNEAALLQAYVQAKAVEKAEATAAAQAAAERRKSRAAARKGQPGLPAEVAPAAAAAAAAPPAPAPAAALQPPVKRLTVKLPMPGSRAKHAPAAAAPPPLATAAAAAAVAAAPLVLKIAPTAAAAAVAVPKVMVAELPQPIALQPPSLQPLQPYMMLLPEQPAAAIDLEAVCARVQPQAFSEQELLAGLLPGVLRGLLPEATAMIQQQRQQHRQQQRHHHHHPHQHNHHPQLHHQPQNLQVQQPGFQFLLQPPEQMLQMPLEPQPSQPQQPAVVGDSASADDEMEEAAGAVSMDVSWRVAVA